MRKINRGDIIICSTNELFGYKSPHLIVGHKYVVRDIIEMSEKCMLDVEHLSTSKIFRFIHERYFIPLDVWREFQLKKLI
jgi:hypothetical protein